MYEQKKNTLLRHVFTCQQRKINKLFSTSDKCLNSLKKNSRSPFATRIPIRRTYIRGHNTVLYEVNDNEFVHF